MISSSDFNFNSFFFLDLALRKNVRLNHQEDCMTIYVEKTTFLYTGFLSSSDSKLLTFLAEFGRSDCPFGLYE